MVKDFSLLLSCCFLSSSLPYYLPPNLHCYPISSPDSCLLLSSCPYTPHLVLLAAILSVVVLSALLFLFQLLVKLLGREEGLLRTTGGLAVLCESWSLKEILLANFKMSTEHTKVEFSIFG